jgi:hypothetical protein
MPRAPGASRAAAEGLFGWSGGLAQVSAKSELAHVIGYVRKNVQLVAINDHLLDAITHELFMKAKNEHAPNAEHLGFIFTDARK